MGQPLHICPYSCVLSGILFLTVCQRNSTIRHSVTINIARARTVAEDVVQQMQHVVNADQGMGISTAAQWLGLATAIPRSPVWRLIDNGLVSQNLRHRSY